LKAGTSSSNPGKTWANGDRNSGEQNYEQPAPPQPEREVKKEREQRVSRQVRRLLTAGSSHASSSMSSTQMPSKSSSMSISQMQPPQSAKGHHIAVGTSLETRTDLSDVPFRSTRRFTLALTWLGREVLRGFIASWTGIATFSPSSVSR